MKLYLLPFILCLFNISTDFQQSVASKEVRLALLIGNGDYGGDEALKNPANDVNGLDKTLQSLGFKTTVRTNRSIKEMKADINRFCTTVSTAKKNGNHPIVFFYYSGHGMQIDGVNYLIPVSHEIADQADVADEAYSMNRLIQKLELTGSTVNIVVMDACRNNPFEKRLRGRTKEFFPELGTGLANINQPTVGTLIAYATAPGKTANDGDGNNSPYAKGLMKHLPTKGLTIESIFREVRNEVYQATRQTQTPWEASSLMGKPLYLGGQLEENSVVENPKKEDKRNIPKGMVYVQGGSFDMGSNDYDDEKPIHKVRVDGFYLDQYEVTFDQYDAYCQAAGITKPSDSDYGRTNRPVINVSWFDAINYCNWRSKQENLTPCYTINGTNVSCNFNANGYRLPTEAEWEYAAGGGVSNRTKWAGTNSESDLGLFGNFCDKNCKYNWRDSTISDGYKYTSPVGSFRPNQLGLYDMSGNVWEWCWDWYDSGYYASFTNSTAQNPKGATSGTSRVVRGGSWGYGTDYFFMRVAVRLSDNPDIRSDDIGFRCLRAY